MQKIELCFRYLPHPQKNLFTYIDICAGIGGMRIAMDSLGGKCVFASEWDKFCQKTYYENFGDMPHGDITKILVERIPNHDILVAGFPCQPFSQAGIATRRKLNKKSGFGDKSQGNVFFRISKIVKAKKPKAILFENVGALEFHDHGKTLETILDILEKECGYYVKYKVINSDRLVPQRRERMYIVGFSKYTKFEFPELPQLNPQLKSILEPKVDSKYTLSDRLWSWLKNHAKKHSKRGNGFGFRLAYPDKTACTLSARYGKDGSEILIPQKCKNPRKLTPRECARLMGFPEEFKIPVSDTQAYKQFGNSVVIPLVYLIGRHMLMALGPLDENRCFPITRARLFPRQEHEIINIKLNAY